ncbi:MAG: hypothetical protein J6S40_00345 [Thermoguttaceae bacterium]|nr:hypothetical protein [Thermoguttaceae bacterium]
MGEQDGKFLTRRIFGESVLLAEVEIPVKMISTGFLIREDPLRRKEPEGSSPKQIESPCTPRKFRQFIEIFKIEKIDTVRSVFERRI